MPTLINYPGLVPESVRWALERPDIVSRAPFGGTLQRQDRLGAKWRIQFNLPPLQGADAGLMSAFLVRASSASIWFQAPDYSYRRRSVASGAPKVDGASQTGATLALKGFTPGQPDAVKAGDRIGLTTGQVVMVTADADADGSGELAASVDPPLRAAPADNSDVYLDQPLAVFFLPTSTAEGFVQPADINSFAFDAEEDFTDGVPAVNYGAWP